MTDATTTPVEIVANAPEAGSDSSGSTLRFLLALGGVAVVAGGIIWYVRSKRIERASATPLPPGSTPLPDIDPWADLDDLMSQAPQQQTVEVEGDGDTVSGIPYVWRVYRGSSQAEGQDTAVYQAIVMLEDDDGNWGYWGENPQTPRFVLAGTEQGAMDKIAQWSDEN